MEENITDWLNFAILIIVVLLIILFIFNYKPVSMLKLQKRKRRNKKYKGKRRGGHWCITYAGILYCIIDALNRNTKMEDISNIYYIFLFVVLDLSYSS